MYNDHTIISMCSLQIYVSKCANLDSCKTALEEVGALIRNTNSLLLYTFKFKYILRRYLTNIPYAQEMQFNSPEVSS
jgi:hypothetical protein